MPPEDVWHPWSDGVDPDRWVYHYTTRETAIGAILPTRQIRFSLYEWMADPRESKTWLFGGEMPEGSGDYNIVDLMHRINELAKENAKLFCVTRDTREIPEPPNERYQRGFAHSRMWNAYAGRHSGICLIFNLDKLHEAITAALGEDNVYAFDVSYGEWTPLQAEAHSIDYASLDRHGVDEALRAHIRTYVDQLFFYKNTDWAAEVEHRWLYFGDSPTPEFVSFDDALEGICVGENYPAMPAGEDPSLLCLAERYGITAIPRITWANGRVRVRFESSGGPPSVHFDDIIGGGRRTRTLVIDEQPQGAEPPPSAVPNSGSTPSP
jgi:hypothetical protein